MGKRGFTLIELLIVIAIVIILAGAMVPLLTGAREDAREARAMADLDAIKTASIMCSNDASGWPPVGSAGAGLINSGLLTGWEGPYLDRWGPAPWAGDVYEIFNSGAQLWAGVDGQVFVGSQIILTPSP